ncbi:pectate lyase, partial [Sarracenia purpurea var. burkii]
ITKRDYAKEEEWQKWTWRSEGDLMMNGAFFIESGDPNGFSKTFTRFESKARIGAVSGEAVTTITRFAGPLPCVPGRPC